MSTTKLTPNKLFTIICFALAGVTLAVYWPLTSHPFIDFDDDQYITGNPNVISGLSWKNVAWAFQTGDAGNWHPLTWISHMIDCDLYGLNPGGHHLTNLLFHIANSLLLFLLLKQMTGGMWRSAFVAALFAWHPVHVESVAWASERKDTLSAFFWLLTLLAYAHYAKKPKVAGYLLALLLFAGGLMSKPMVVTLPFVLLLLDFWPLNRLHLPGFGAGSNLENVPTQNPAAKSRARVAIFLVVEKIPFFALAAAASVVTFLVQKTAGAFWQAPFSFRMANAAVAYARYLFKLFWPTDLAIVYPYPHHWSALFVAGAVLLLVTGSALFVFRARKNPYLVVGWLWFLGTLVPTIGFVQVGVQSMADRYTYIPSIGLFILVVWGVDALFDSRAEWRRFLPLAGGMVLAGCLAVTSLQLNYWHDSMELFLRAVAVTTDNYVADNALGKVFEKSGQKDKALFLYSETVRLEPRYPQGQFNLAISLLEYGKTDEALQHLIVAANLSPHDPDIQYDLGTFFLLHNQPDKAAEHFMAVIDENPVFPEAQYHLAQALARQHKSGDAITHYRAALRLAPDLLGALNELAWILATDSNSENRSGPESLQLARHACDLTKNQQPVFITTLAAAYAQTGQFEKAIAALKTSSDIAVSTDDKEIAAKNAQILKTFQNNQPFRENN
jgi:protein O-mannosyl-transferase